MDRVISLLPSGQVATGVAAVVGLNIQSVIVVYVATRAGNVCMAIGQRETCSGVIEGDIGPRGCVVTLGAIGERKGRTSLWMRRIIRLLPSGEVAASVSAIGGSNLEIVVVVDMATGAGDIRVPIREWEACRAVVKGDVGPSGCVVALGTIREREGRTSLWMRRIICPLPGGEVTASVSTIGRSDLEIEVIVDMATGAGDVGMASSKGKPGCAVVKFRS